MRECTVGRPFVGPSGRMLDDMLKAHGIHRDRLIITNALLCRPPGNALGDYRADVVRRNAARKRVAKATGSTYVPLADPFLCCRPRLLSELSTVRAIIAMGSSALWSMVGERAMARWAGSPLVTTVPVVSAALAAALTSPTTTHALTSVDDVPLPGAMRPPDSDGAVRRPQGSVWVLPTFHPAFIMREEGRIFSTVLKRHFAKAVRIYKDDATRWDEPNMVAPGSFAESLAMIRAIHTSGRPVAVDIESTSADVMSCDLTAFGLSCGDSGTVSVLYWKIDGTPAWSASELHTLDSAIRDVLSDGRTVKVFHNMAFDVFVLERLGYDIRGTLHDTMLLHHSATSELPHDLNFLATLYTDMRFYKGDVREGGHFRPPDDATFARYNARDCLVTSRVFPLVASDCREQMQVYNQERALIRQGMNMTRVGMRVDLERVVEIRDAMSTQADICLQRMRDLLAQVPYEATMLTLAEDAKRKGGNWKLWEEHAHSFKPASPYCLQTAIQCLGLPISDKTVGKKRARTATNLIATGKDVLNTVAPYCDERGVEFIQALVGQVDIKKVESYGQLGWRQATKLVGTYLDPMRDYLGPDGRLHPSWKVHGTVSGRYATSSPNVQNWPALMKPLIVPRDGCVFVEMDYSQLEWRVSAVLSGDPALLAAFLASDPHTAAAASLFGVPYNDVTKAMRRFWKSFLYAFSYGATLDKIHEQMVLADRKTTKQDVTKMMDALKARYPIWMRYREQLPILARKQGYLADGLLGRRRLFLGGVDPTKALNFPAQGTAAAIINDGTLKLAPKLRRDFPTAEIINQCHDALTIECDEKDAYAITRLVLEIMPGPYKLEARDPVLFPVDVEVNRRWGNDSINIRQMLGA